jgi:hypothetical protein
MNGESLHLRRTLGVFAVGALSFTVFSYNPRAPAVAAGPRLIVFYGGVLDGRRAYLTDIHDVIGFVGSYNRSRAAAPADTVGRPYAVVALYWNNLLWEPFAADTARLKHLPEPHPATPFSPPPPNARGNEDPRRWIQSARLYLDEDGKPPIFASRQGLTVVNFNGLAILQKHGVPTGDSESWKR